MEELKSECVELANGLIMELKLPLPRIKWFCEVNSMLYVHLVAEICGFWPSGVVEFPRSFDDELNNFKLVLDLFEEKYLKRRLKYVTAENLASNDVSSVFNSLKNFNDYFNLFKIRKNVSKSIYHKCPLIEQSLSPSEPDFSFKLKENRLKCNWKENFMRAAKTYGYQIEGKSPKSNKNRISRYEDENLIDYLKDRFEPMDLSVRIEDKMRNDYRKRIKTLKIPIKNTTIDDYLEENVVKHEKMRDFYVNQMKARQRKFLINEKKRKYLKINNELIDKKSEKIKLIKLIDKLKSKEKSIKLKKQNIDQKLFIETYANAIKMEKWKFDEIMKNEKKMENRKINEELNEIICQIPDLHLIDTETIKNDLCKSSYVITST